VRFLGYRYDIEDVMAAMDVFVLTFYGKAAARAGAGRALGKPIVFLTVKGYAW
jgi:hypothetical protein